MYCARITVLTVAFGLILGGCSPGTPATTPAPVSIAVSRTPLSLPFYVAESQGLFEAGGISATLHDCIGGHRCLAAALRGDVEFATTSDSPVMFNSFERDDIALLATFVGSENDVKLITRKSSGVRNASDLVSKRVGIVVGTSSQYFLETWLLFGGVDPTRVTTVALQPEEMPTALQAGEVDALSVWEPFGFRARQLLGPELAVLENHGIYRETFNLVSRRDRLDEYQVAARGVLQALAAAIDFIRQDPTAAQEILRQRLQVETDFVAWVWNDFDYSLSLDQALISTLENQARWAIAHGLVAGDRLPAYLDLLAPEALVAVAPDAVSTVH